ncbi:hypothetical protein HanPSC8_Chr03g0122501 [Helianthus annuus]|nr:hypothetical protein HanPSC8_Chr03g0122501 [Helianthus annuus]
MTAPFIFTNDIILCLDATGLIILEIQPVRKQEDEEIHGLHIEVVEGR